MMTAFPPVIGQSVGEGTKAKGVFGRSVDPAKYVVERARFERPVIQIPPNGPKFEFPVGVEGITVAGQVGAATHRYLGDNATVMQVTHRDARTIELSGIFPGITGSSNMQDLLEVITAVAPRGYWNLTLPSSIFPRVQQVVVMDYSFDHPQEDRDDNWFYSISLARTGTGAKVKKSTKTKSPSNPTSSVKGKSPRIFTTTAGARTLRAVAQNVYKDATRWTEILNKNYKTLAALNTPLVQMQTKQLPLGMKLNY